MLQDIEAGRAPEIDALVGSVVELGRLTDTPTPHIDTVYALVKLLAQTMEQERGPGAHAAGELKPIAARGRSMKHATLRQLKVFESVARNLSFSRAAEELHLTQPAVSTQVKKLEEHAGNALFEQFGKKIYLTPAGTELLQISRAIIQQFEAAEIAMTQFKGVSGGKLNVGGDQRRRLLLPAPAGRVREPPPRRDAELLGAQPRRPARRTSTTT